MSTQNSSLEASSELNSPKNSSYNPDGCFEKKYNHEYAKGLKSVLRMMQLGEIADEINNIIGVEDEKEPEDNKIEIPLIMDNKISPNQENSNFLKYFAMKRLERYKSKILTQEKLERIQTLLSFPNRKIEKYQAKRIFRRLRKELPELGYLFASGIIFRKEFMESESFNVANYINFLIRIFNIQKMFSFMIDLIYNFSVLSVSEESFSEFISKYSNNIELLKNAFKNEDEPLKEYYIPYITSHFAFKYNNLKQDHLNFREIIFSEDLQNFLNMDNIPKSSNPLTNTQFFKVYSFFLRLDSQKQGLLDREDLKHFGSDTFSNVFLNRLFEIFQTYDDGKFDFTLFLQFRNAVENIKSTQGTNLFFNAIDIDGKGYISPDDILYFYKGMCQELNCNMNDFDAYLARLYDLIGYNSSNITKELLEQSKLQDLFFKLLVDVGTFKSWQTQDFKEGNEEEEEEEGKYDL